MAPEMLLRQEYGCAVDMWAMGVCAYVFAFGGFPYYSKDKDELDKMVTMNDPEPTFTVKSSEVREPSDAIVEFVKNLLVADPEDRKTATECLQLEVFRIYRRNLRRSFSAKSIWSTLSSTSKRSSKSSNTGSSTSPTKRDSAGSSSQGTPPPDLAFLELRSVPDADAQADIDDIIQVIERESTYGSDLESNWASASEGPRVASGAPGTMSPVRPGVDSGSGILTLRGRKTSRKEMLRRLRDETSSSNNAAEGPGGTRISSASGRRVSWLDREFSSFGDQEEDGDSLQKIASGSSLSRLSPRSFGDVDSEKALSLSTTDLTRSFLGVSISSLYKRL